MTGLDVVIVSILVLAAVRGSVRGAVVEAYGPIAVLVALLAAAQWAAGFSESIERFLAIDDAPVLVATAGFVLAFIVVYGALWMLGVGLGRIWTHGLAGAVSRLIGAALSAAKWAAVIATVGLATELIPRGNGRVLDAADSVVIAKLVECAKRPIAVTPDGRLD